MRGAYIGDIVGSVFEWKQFKSRVFPLFSRKSRPTDDSLMTAAVALAFGTAREKKLELTERILSPLLCRFMRMIGRKYPHAGYGTAFKRWLFDDAMGPYGSRGNGAAMRVSPAGWYAGSLEEAEKLGKISASVSHNEASAELAARAVAGAVYLARQGEKQEALRRYLNQYYSLDFTIDSMRQDYRGDASCDGSVPQALEAFLEADDFEGAIRNAISLGGDSDTLAAIAGSLAEPCFGIPEAILKKAEPLFTEEMQEALRQYERLTGRGKEEQPWNTGISMIKRNN
jgi:ADP-ribosyl-[dinitrogen reductase] hydrolase